MSRVHQIFITQTKGMPMVARDLVRALPGHGLDGDRYGAHAGTFSPKVHKPDYELTLIELENVRAFAATGNGFTAADCRRNIVTEGVRLNALVGQEFRVGDVRVKGIRLCEPCAYLARKTGCAVVPGLNGKAGLRAQILTEGTIRIGDPVSLDPATSPAGSD